MRLASTHEAARLCVGVEDRELVAAQTRDDVAFPRQRHQAAGDVGDQFVAGAVAVGVVDQLEPVEVEREHPDRPPAAAHLGQGLGQAFAEQRPVGQAGEVVVVGHVPGAGFAGDQRPGRASAPQENCSAERTEDQYRRENHGLGPLEEHMRRLLRCPVHARHETPLTVPKLADGFPRLPGHSTARVDVQILDQEALAERRLEPGVQRIDRDDDRRFAQLGGPVEIRLHERDGHDGRHVPDEAERTLLKRGHHSFFAAAGGGGLPCSPALKGANLRHEWRGDGLDVSVGFGGRVLAEVHRVDGTVAAVQDIGALKPGRVVQEGADVVAGPGRIVPAAEVPHGVIPGGLPDDAAFHLGDPAADAAGDQGFFPGGDPFVRDMSGVGPAAEEPGDQQRE